MADKFCGELTDEIMQDEFEYHKYSECWHETEDTYITPEEKQNMDNMSQKYMGESADCVFNAFKQKENLVSEIDKCIAEFEEKRTQKWQVIFEKMQAKDKIHSEQKL